MSCRGRVLIIHGTVSKMGVIQSLQKNIEDVDIALRLLDSESDESEEMAMNFRYLLGENCDNVCLITEKLMVRGVLSRMKWYDMHKRPTDLKNVDVYTFEVCGNNVYIFPSLNI